MKLIQEDQEVFKQYFKNNVLKWNDIKDFSPLAIRKKRVELIVKVECTQSCNYCYIHNYGNLLYLNRADNKKIKENISKLLNYFLEEEIYQFEWELFSGDLFYDNFFFEIIDLFYNYYLEVEKKCPDFIYYAPSLAKINIPCNFSFANDKNKILKIQEIIDKFQNNLKVRIQFSWSTDGFFLTDTREKKELSEDFYKNSFEFCKKNNYRVHPMIAAINIDKWIENYDWWFEKFKTYFGIKEKEITWSMLEVRNDDWTQEKIDKYLLLLNHIIEKRFEECNNDIKTFAIHLFSADVKLLKQYNFPSRRASMDPINFKFYSFDLENNTSTHMQCAVGMATAIDCYTLEIVPCHRLAYQQFRGAKFIEKNNKIIDIIALDGFNAYLNISLKNPMMGLKCNYCDYKNVCMKGCLGAQYEATGDYQVPCETVCNLLKAKYSFLTKKYTEMGLFSYVLNHPELFDSRIQQTISELLYIQEINQDA